MTSGNARDWPELHGLGIHGWWSLQIPRLWIRRDHGTDSIFLSSVAVRKKPSTTNLWKTMRDDTAAMAFIDGVAILLCLPALGHPKFLNNQHFR